jgi:hypothetical protein
MDVRAAFVLHGPFLSVLLLLLHIDRGVIGDFAAQRAEDAGSPRARAK